MELVEGRDVQASAERTWAIVTDFDHFTEILSGIRHIERLDSGDGFVVGTRWRETRVMFRREAVEEMVVTALEPGRSYVVESDAGNAHYRSEFRVEPLKAGRSRISWTFAAETTGLFARLMTATLGRLFLGSMRKTLRRDLDDIALAAEAAP